MAKTNPFTFLQQVRTEVGKVVWPTRREVLLTTIMVFIMAALTATFFSLVDLAIQPFIGHRLEAIGMGFQQGRLFFLSPGTGIMPLGQ